MAKPVERHRHRSLLRASNHYAMIPPSTVTIDALRLKAQRGYVAGGIVFGYGNVTVFDEGGQRSHVLREIREDEAAVVQRIFSMAAGGKGLRTIARTLNAEGLRSPRARPGRHHSWAPSSVRAVLFNPLYKGEVVWGRTKKRDAWGGRKESDRPVNEWVVTTVEDLRIVSDELWANAHDALLSRQKAYGFKRGSPRPTGAFDSKISAHRDGRVWRLRGDNRPDVER